ncbi:fatty acyl-AMP ligase [Streptomyces sp. NPDC046197]|uniref:fatty acyl-AMP ligase n=1 Tax=Streptomyces sp. NPDC046197 TaxID=3154337 RepID=UPI0033E3E8D9
MTGHRTFTELIQEQAARTPDREALILLGERSGALWPRTVSYAELDRAARVLAGRLLRHTGPGERALVVHRGRAAFATSFLACLYAGVVAVPVAPPGGRAHHDERIAGIVKDAAVSCALTSTGEAAEVSQLLARTGHGHVTCVLTDAPVPAELRPDSESTGAAPASGSGAARRTAGAFPAGRSGAPGSTPAPEAAAFLQYTSGSTREPRGVVVSHGSLLANLRAIGDALGTRPGIRLGGWLPFHHDMGLVGQLLLPLWLGGTAVLLSPAAFVKRPAHWLETISRYRLAVSGAPDFAYELCVRRINDSQLAGLDLSHWRVAVSGGEPVNPDTLRAFAERFAPAGLRPEALVCCYGLAEATLLVSGSATAPALSGSGAGQAHCGPAASCDIRIVDPETCEELPEGRTGEIWVRGPGVAAGYWARPAETAAAFDGHLASGRGGHLRTGDLGTLQGGLLRVTGRIKDVIVVAGRNLYPQDLERTVQRVTGLFGAGTAFAVPGERERIVVVQELRARSHYDIDLGALASAVQQRLREEHEVTAGAVLLVRPGTVRRTTSGKVERAAMRRLFLRGEVRALHQRVEPEIERLVTPGRRR